MAATCARFIAIQRQNTPRRHIPTPRQIHQTLDKSRFIFRLSDVVRELEAENIGVAQPNYIYSVQ